VASYLTICQSVHRKMRGGNAQPGSQPTAIPAAANLDQMVYDIIDAVALAWSNIQNLHDDWKWMRKKGAFPLVNGTRTNSVAVIRATIPTYDRLRPMDAGGGPIYVYIYDSGASPRTDNRLWYVDWENWRGWTDAQPFQQAMPSRFTEHPDFTLEFDPTPNLAPSGAPWFVELDYKKTNQVLVAAADIPECPDKYHELIAWMAVILVCETRQTTGMLLNQAQLEVYGSQKQEGRLEMLERDQLPPLLLDTMYAGW
jgi:hypothetical protein